jgi:hypothetical protein
MMAKLRQRHTFRGRVRPPTKHPRNPYPPPGSHVEPSLRTGFFFFCCESVGCVTGHGQNGTEREPRLRCWHLHCEQLIGRRGTVRRVTPVRKRHGTPVRRAPRVARTAVPGPTRSHCAVTVATYRRLRIGLCAGLSIFLADENRSRCFLTWLIRCLLCVMIASSILLEAKYTFH